MNLTPSEAAAALADIEATRRQSRQAFSYRMASPYLLLWGTIWVAGGLITDLAPSIAGTAWNSLNAAGVLASAAIGFAGMRRHAGVKAGVAWTWRFAGTVAALGVFVGLTFAILGLYAADQGMAFAAALTGAIYTALGFWVGMRYAVVGVLLTALAAAVHFLHLPHATAVIAVAGGAALIIGGLWMRRV